MDLGVGNSLKAIFKEKKVLEEVQTPHDDNKASLKHTRLEGKGAEVVQNKMNRAQDSIF